MILKTLSYQTSDGSIHPTIEAAQNHELKSFLSRSSEVAANQLSQCVDYLISNKDKIIDLLTMKASSKAKARKINGAVKKRAAKKAATGELSEAEQAEVENL